MRPECPPLADQDAPDMADLGSWRNASPAPLQPWRLSLWAAVTHCKQVAVVGPSPLHSRGTLRTRCRRWRWGRRGRGWFRARGERPVEADLAETGYLLG